MWEREEEEEGGCRGGGEGAGESNRFYRLKVAPVAEYGRLGGLRFVSCMLHDLLVGLECKARCS